MQDERAAAAASAVPAEVRFQTFHLIAEDGRGFSGGAAVVETLARLRATRRLAPLLRRGPLPAIVDALYRLLAKTKGVVGKVVPDAPGPERWP